MAVSSTLSKSSTSSKSTATFSDSYLAQRLSGVSVFQRFARANSKRHQECLFLKNDTIDRVSYSELAKGAGGGFVLNCVLKDDNPYEVAIKAIPYKDITDHGACDTITNMETDRSKTYMRLLNRFVVLA